MHAVTILKNSQSSINICHRGSGSVLSDGMFSGWGCGKNEICPAWHYKSVALLSSSRFYET